MKMTTSLQARIALAVGLSVTLLWLAAAALTAHRMGREMEEVFDDGLKATAERILPIARHDLRDDRPRKVGKDGHDDEHDDDDEEDNDRRAALTRRDARYGENVDFVVRAPDGRVLLASKGADPARFPAYAGDGYSRTETDRLYYAQSPDGRMTIAVSEPLNQRTELSRKILLGLALPLLVVIPFSLAAIIFAVRRSLRPVRGLREELSSRSAQDLSPLADQNLPGELRPITAGINQLLERLKAAFSAERTFAANAAHELRTPVAGAIAQAQRIRSETKEELTSQRATEIETTLKRLMRMSEKLMQLARAEGSRLRSDEAADLRPVLRMIVGDFERVGEGRIELTLPETPVLSTLDPDALGILARNLIENALKHGSQDENVEVGLGEDGLLTVANDGATLPPEAMERLMRRFERGNGKIDGSGLGLSIVKVICDRAGADITVVSPRQLRDEGVELRVRLPLA